MFKAEKEGSRILLVEGELLEFRKMNNNSNTNNNNNNNLCWNGCYPVPFSAAETDPFKHTSAIPSSFFQLDGIGRLAVECSLHSFSDGSPTLSTAQSS
jgi:hypothetical protein